ncbi:transcriptional regulator GcvA [Massilia sp. W12]|uniref:transcriptional regulator GcvA n=1 Tax=Massilia sp. W12 TaxID=3126507 RepID=UPI0030D22E42
MHPLRRLPNLAALRAFEAAARHGNFSRAAEEIHLTHGAISHQVRQLEAELGVALFVRHGKRLSVTPQGEEFAAVIRHSLSDIAQAAQRLQRSQDHRRLAVTALPSFASRWLTPRLGRFIELHPDLELSLQATNHLSDYVRDGIDIGIRFGFGNYPGLQSEHLMDDYYYPVVSPHYNGGRLPRTLEDLQHATLLRCDGEPWLPWFRLAGLERAEPETGLLFQDSSMLTRAAIDAQGVALGRHSIVQSDIEHGLLCKLSDVHLPSASSYYLAYLPQALQKPQVAAFRSWLLEEIQSVKR